MKLDKFDREILRVLQQDATVSMADLSQRVGLSHTPCWRRVKRMEADGIILGKVTLLNSKKLNLGVSVFIYVTLKNHDGDSLTDFESAVQNIDEIVECHTTSENTATKATDASLLLTPVTPWMISPDDVM